MDYQNYTVTIMKDKGTIRNSPLCHYHETLDKKMDGGVMQDADVEGNVNVCNEDDGGIGANCSLTMSQYNKIRNSSRIITCYQLPRTIFDEGTLNRIARQHYEKNFNSTSIEFLITKNWEYFYHWDTTELAKGNHWKVFNIQGSHRTWYAGSSVIFETVNAVMEYNELLMRQQSSL